MGCSIVLSLPRRMPAALGVGAFLKNTLCLIEGDKAYVSHDNGSLDNVDAIEGFERTAREMMAMAKLKPKAVAHDLHPDFASTRWAKEVCGDGAFASRTDSHTPHLTSPSRGEGLYSVSGSKPVAVGVQHHHAHIAAIMAEHGTAGPVLGLALDGFGLGPNNEAWGGELLRVDPNGFERLGHLYPLPHPGGDIAARQPWRMGAAALWAMERGDEVPSWFKEFENAGVLVSMMDRGLNCPLTSSCGRLFDAACGILGVVPMAEFEGQAPMALEAMVQKPVVDPGGWCFEDFMLDLRPLLERLLACESQEGAEIFHGTLIAALAQWAEKAADMTGINSVALGGGCFFNKVLREGLCRRIIASGLTPLLPQQMSFGDPAISLGQAWATSLSLSKGVMVR